MKLSDLAPHPQNPRTITDEKLKQLGKSLKEFGDLSGIVFNKKTKHLIGGHQRLKEFPPDTEVTMIDKENGFFIIDGKRYSYREVSWNEVTEKAANIAANRHGGEWDLPKLSDWLLELDAANFNMDLVGYSENELKDFFDVNLKDEAKLEAIEAMDEAPELGLVHDYIVLMFTKKEKFEAARKHYKLNQVKLNISGSNSDAKGFLRSGTARLLIADNHF